MIYLTCNILSIISLLLMGCVSYHGFAYDIFNEDPRLGLNNHIILYFSTIFLYAFTISLVMFYLIGSGKRIKELIMHYNLNKEQYNEVLQIKRIFFPPITINLVLVPAAFFLYAAVDQLDINRLWYDAILIISFFHYAYVIYLQLGIFKKDVAILENIGEQIKKSDR